MNNDTPGNRLYGAIVKRLTPHYPAGARDLDWDVLPSTLATLAKERDAALAREADALATVAAHSREIADLRLALAAEQGDPVGAPDPAWTRIGGGWERDYPDGEFGGVLRDGRWYRGTFGQPARAHGQATGQRAGMIACDKDTP